MACATRSHHMTFDSPCQHARDAREARHKIRRSVAGVAATLQLWREKSRQRRALRDLDEHQLADVGITRWDAEREARKWFWR